jgi:hypothetical protein
LVLVSILGINPIWLAASRVLSKPNPKPVAGISTPETFLIRPSNRSPPRSDPAL